MREYRRKFITLILALVGSVLLTVLIATGVYTYANYWSELKITMNQVLAPMESPSFGGFGQAGEPPASPYAPDMREDFFNAEKPGDEGEKRPAPSGKKSIGQNLAYDKQITVLIYSEDGGIRVVSTSSDLDESQIEEAAVKAAAAEEDFGKISDMQLIYSKASGSEYTRIALASTSYVTKPTIMLAGALAAVFAAAMILFYFISRYISGLAVKPLENSIEMEKQFVADISHDLKTPLTVILADNGILKENTDSTVAEQMQWVESIDEAAASMQKMINEMLTLSQMDSPQLTVEKKRVNMSDAVMRCALQMESIAYEKGVEFDYDGIESDIFVNGNEDYIARICAGLIGNAAKYEPSGGKIEVKLTSSKKKAVLCVSNKLGVISKDDLEHIFERFYRADKSRSGGDGHGLGLAIAKKMTELMGGEISASSDAENGTVFKVALNLD